MSDHIAVVYPDENTAVQMRDTLARLQTERLAKLADDAVVVKNQDGKVRLNQTAPLVATGAAGGALWGTLIGMLFLAPLLGIWVAARNAAPVRIDWQFTTADARIVLKHLYPVLEPDN